jgi:hypothetical protein
MNYHKMDKKHRDSWYQITKQCDANGKPTDLALAITALENNGCSCETYEEGACMACLCEKALYSLYCEIQENKYHTRLLQR